MLWGHATARIAHTTHTAAHTASHVKAGCTASVGNIAHPHISGRGITFSERIRGWALPHSSSNHSLQGRKVYAAKVRHTASTGTHTAARIAHTTHTAAHITGTDTHIVAHVINKLVVYAPIKRSLRAGGITASGSAHATHVFPQRREIYVAKVG